MDNILSYCDTKPALETGDAHLVSYALLFTVTLCDYFLPLLKISVIFFSNAITKPFAIVSQRFLFC